MKSPEKFIELLFCTLCIMIFFLSYGYLQEKLMTRPYGDKEEMFQYSAFLVLSNRVVAMFIALLMLGCRGEPIRNVAPLKNYVNVSISNFIATYCQYEALKYVSFPTQTLGKCGKMIPVLILGSLFHHKVYNWKDYAVAISVMVGCTLFLVTGEITSPINAPQDSPIGLLLLLAYLFADGFTSTFQEKLFKGYSMSIYNQMLYVNTSSAFLSIIVLLANSTFYSAIIFAYQNFDILIDAFLLSLCASLGQIAIYYTIKNFGALTYSTIMTTRQFASLLLSSIIFLHPISILQWVGIALVFAGLYYKGYMNERERIKTYEIGPPPPYSEINRLMIQKV